MYLWTNMRPPEDMTCECFLTFPQHCTQDEWFEVFPSKSVTCETQFMVFVTQEYFFKIQAWNGIRLPPPPTLCHPYLLYKLWCYTRISSPEKSHNNPCEKNTIILHVCLIWLINCTFQLFAGIVDPFFSFMNKANFSSQWKPLVLI